MTSAAKLQTRFAYIVNEMVQVLVRLITYTINEVVRLLLHVLELYI